mmetsp:Transcript_71564/g.232644  ORF Transcript_71564/g.232644 Transcript_71564/m.232644 type:complete len:270 (+) Transcript_71564:536-1345(+)
MSEMASPRRFRQCPRLLRALMLAQPRRKSRLLRGSRRQLLWAKAQRHLRAETWKRKVGAWRAVPPTRGPVQCQRWTAPRLGEQDRNSGTRAKMRQLCSKVVGPRIGRDAAAPRPRPCLLWQSRRTHPQLGQVGNSKHYRGRQSPAAALASPRVAQCSQMSPRMSARAWGREKVPVPKKTRRCRSPRHLPRLCPTEAWLHTRRRPRFFRQPRPRHRPLSQHRLLLPRLLPSLPSPAVLRITLAAARRNCLPRCSSSKPSSRHRAGKPMSS